VRYTRRVIADLCWLDEAPWVPNRRYVLRQGTLETLAMIAEVRFARDIATMGEVERGAIGPNDIVSVCLAARDPLLADSYADLPGAGAFVLIDPDTNQTAAAGMIREIPE
jgi:sulfate adenylyltransferase subunit 1 (EFTu-like GTPase family)